MKKIGALVIIIILLFSTTAFAGENLFLNSGFEEYEGTVLKRWDTDAYNTGTSVFSKQEDGRNGSICAKIANVEANDSRFVQTVRVEPDTLYRFSAYVKCSGLDENIVGANISVLNVMTTPESVHDTDGEWKLLEIYGKTGSDQKTVRAALRLGGYNNVITGEAYFDDATFEKVNAAPAGVTVQDFSPGAEGASGSDDFVYDLTPVIIFLGIVFVFVVYAVYKRILQKNTIAIDEGRKRSNIVLILVIAAFVRLVIAYMIPGHSTDMGCFRGWSDHIVSGGFAQFYTSGVFTDYPPGYMYILYLLGNIRALFGISSSSALFGLMLKLPAIICDVLTAYLVYHVARKSINQKFALGLALLMAFNPVTIINSAAWGQIDSIFVLLIVLSIRLFQKQKVLFACLLYTAALLIKPVALLYAPLMLFMAIDVIRQKRGRGVVQVLDGLLVSLVVFVVVLLPFWGTQEPLWILDKYLGTAGSYPYASVNACNFFSLIGGNWASDTMTVLPGMFDSGGDIMAKTFGTVMVVVIVAISAVLFFKAKGKGKAYLVGAFMIMGIFLFGHYMHERYNFGVLLLLIMAYIHFKDRRILAIFAGFSLTTLINIGHVLYHMHFYEDAQLLLQIISGLNILIFFYFAYVCVDILLLKRNKGTPMLLDEEMPVYTVNKEIDGDILEMDDATMDTTDDVIVDTIDDAAEEPVDDSGDDGGIAPFEEEVQWEEVREPIPIFIPQKRQRYTAKDRLLMWGLTLIYALISFVNLGSTNVPETYWRSSLNGDYAVLQFEQEFDVKQIRYYGGIVGHNDQEFSVQALKDGEYEEVVRVSQKNGNMYNWVFVAAEFKTDSVKLLAKTSNVWLNELAFITPEGESIPYTVIQSNSFEQRGESDAAHLGDEQGTVPYAPSFMTGMYFDEVYHARTAYEHYTGMSPYELSHPPLGKVFIMGGVAAFGMNPFGWRFVGNLFGIAMVPLMYMLGKLLFKKSGYAFMAAFLFAFDFMHFAQTRIATIDSYGVFFIIAMFYFMYKFYSTTNYNLGKLPRQLVPLGLCGIMFGLGAASKWICIYAGAGLAVMLFTYVYKRYKEYKYAKAHIDTVSEQDRPLLEEVISKFKSNTAITGIFCVVFFIVIPIAIYLASYIPYTMVTEGMSYGLSDIWQNQQFMFSYHSKLTAGHPFASQWWEWPLMFTPIWYYKGEYLPQGVTASISSFGNPAVWWIGFAAIIILIILVIQGKFKKDTGIFLVMCGLATNFLPWVIVTRATFIYHYFATVPFMVFAIVYCFKYFEKKSSKVKKVRYVYMAIVLVLFLMYYPILSGMPVSVEYARLLRWFPGWTLFAG
ncbi:glycosyltransferase family 39 protein [Clostridia bacterium OttesenSCG-928-F22]|nr:glycosyltransferase family 39 protein [Clostridia bacterium OttesenSCG-928-F22]